jgi:hypothetical protein
MRSPKCWTVAKTSLRSTGSGESVSKSPSVQREPTLERIDREN